MDIKYKRMNSNERVRILNPGGVSIPRPEGERRMGGKEFTHAKSSKVDEFAVWLGLPKVLG